MTILKIVHKCTYLQKLYKQMYTNDCSDKTCNVTYQQTICMYYSKTYLTIKHKCMETNANVNKREEMRLFKVQYISKFKRFYYECLVGSNTTVWCMFYSFHYIKDTNTNSVYLLNTLISSWCTFSFILNSSPIKSSRCLLEQDTSFVFIV